MVREKGAALIERPPPFLTGEVSLTFLAGLLLPALGFLRHCQLSPPSFGIRERSRHLLWLPPGTLTDVAARGCHKGWPKPPTLIPDVDYGRDPRSVKHKRASKVKILTLHARAELLLFCVSFERQLDQAIEQLWIGKTARVPHLRVHADRREAGNRVDFVDVEHAAVAGEKEIDARQIGRASCRDR